MWKGYQSISPGTTEIEFDDLPAGLYACFTGYLPASRLGALPTVTKGYLLVMIYQQPADRYKYYEWMDSTNGDKWKACFKQGVWTTWVKNSFVLKSGDTMTGNLELTTTGSNVFRKLGCKTIANAGGFNLWLGTPNVSFAYKNFLKYLFLTIDGGFRIVSAAGPLFSTGKKSLNTQRISF